MGHLCSVLETKAHELHHGCEHPRSKNSYHQSRANELRNVRQGHFLDLSYRLKDANQETDEQRHGHDRQTHQNCSEHSLSYQFENSA